MITLITRSGLTLQVTPEPDLTLGRVYYPVDRIGTFTLETDDTMDGVTRVHVVYGRWTAPTMFGDGVLPETPVIYGVRNLVGGWVFNPADYQPGDHRRYPPSAPARRRTGPYQSDHAPDGTCRRLADIALTLAADFEAREDKPQIDRARLAQLAPGRYRSLLTQIRQVTVEIGRLDCERDRLVAAADVQAALLPTSERLAWNA
jgi:hypothetical protein